MALVKSLSGTSVQCHLCGRTRNASCYLNEIKMDKLIKLLHEGNYSCVIKNKEISTFTQRGITDLYDC